MAAEENLHNHVNPPAAVSRAASTYVLDLTSWCVKSGSVQLPPKLLAHFSVGKVVARSDGGEVALELLAPRTLTGLDGYFALHGLRANDRLEFAFEGGELRIAALRRDRQAQTSNGSRAQRRAPAAPETDRAPRHHAAAGAGGTAEAGDETPKRRASDWTDAVDRGVAQAAALRKEQSTPGIVVDRFRGAVGELVPGKAAAQQRSAAPAPARGQAAPTSGQFAQTRSVTRVRIEGGVPARSSNGELRPKDRWSAHEVWARQTNAHWHSLDTVQAAGSADHAQDPDFPDTVVRAFRRSPNGTLHDEPLNSPAEPAAAERYSPMNAGWMTMQASTERRAVNAATRTHAPVASASGGSVNESRTQAQRRAAQEPQPEHGLTAQASTWNRAVAPFTATPAAGHVISVPEDSDLTREAVDWVPSREADVEPQAVEIAGGFDEPLDGPEPARAPRRSVMERIGIRLGLGRERSLGDGGGASDHPTYPSTSGTARYAAPTAGAAWNAQLGQAEARAGAAPVDEQPRFVPRHAAPQAELQPTRQPAPEPAQQAERAVRHVATATALQDALIDLEDEALTRAHAARRSAREATEDEVTAPAPTATVEDDIAFLEGYLRRPGTPAVVRSLDLAERLGMSPERVARALDRLAEHRERFSKIKDGAYMVRQTSSLG